MGTRTIDCDCSDEYGPCEQHCEMLVTREGASHRTADELARVFIDDALNLGAELSPYGQGVLEKVDAAFEADGSWITDPDLAEALRDLSFQVEQYLADLVVTWDDGYTIVRPSADCPLYADNASA